MPAGIIVFLAFALLGTYVLRRQTAREFPQGTTRCRRSQGARAGRGDPGVAPTDARRSSAVSPAVPIPEQLRQLADLREDGNITAEEYQAAKTQLMHS